MERPAMVATDVARLDTILGGGILERSMLVLCGPPGSGKTVLASQIMAAVVDRGEPVLLVTLFGEPQGKLIAHLRTFSFFHSEQLGDTIKLLNLQHPLLSGLDAAADTLVREARELGARMVVLFGLGDILLDSPTPPASSGFLYKLSAKLSLLGINLISTLTLEPGAEFALPALAAFDTIIALSHEHAAGTLRSLRVVKHRGAAPLPGYHSFRIDAGGVHCYPRLEALDQPGTLEIEEGRAAFGLSALDTAMDGGPNNATATLLHGPAAAARALGMRWLLHGLRSGQHACLVSLREPASSLLRSGGATRLQPAEYEGRLLLRTYRQTGLLPDQLAHELLGALHGADRWRVLIDGVAAVAPLLAREDRAWHYWAALLRELSTRGATTLLLDDRQSTDAELSTLSDNMLRVYRRQASIHCSVLEMRYSPFDGRPVVLDG